MSDFMKWLYANYIRRQLDAVQKDDYAFHFDLLNNELTPDFQAELEACLEFTAVHAFLPGMRTSSGLSAAVQKA